MTASSFPLSGLFTLGSRRARLARVGASLALSEALGDTDHPPLDDEEVDRDLADPPLLVGPRDQLVVAGSLYESEQASPSRLHPVGEKPHRLPDPGRPVRRLIGDDEGHAVMMRVAAPSWRMRCVESGPPQWVTRGGLHRVPAITKAETFNRIADKTGLKRIQVREVFDEMANLAYKEAKNGFTIPGIGKLVIVDRKARLGRNPATGAQIQIPAKRVLKFRIAKQANDATVPAKAAKKK